MEKKGDLLNQLAIISDLIENLNTDSKTNILTLELNEKAFNDAFEMIEKFMHTAFEGGRHQNRVNKISCS